MKLKHRRLAEVGTSELTEEDCALILEDICPFAYFVHRDQYAVMFWIPSADYPKDRENAEEELRDYGFSEQFMTVWKQACEENLEFLMVDRDA